MGAVTSEVWETSEVCGELPHIDPQAERNKQKETVSVQARKTVPLPFWKVLFCLIPKNLSLNLDEFLQRQAFLSFPSGFGKNRPIARVTATAAAGQRVAFATSATSACLTTIPISAHRMTRV